MVRLLGLNKVSEYTSGEAISHRYVVDTRIHNSGLEIDVALTILAPPCGTIVLNPN